MISRLWNSKSLLQWGRALWASAPPSTKGYDSGLWFPPDQAAADDFDRYSRDFGVRYYREGIRRIQRRAKAFLVDDASAEKLASFLRGRLQQGIPTCAIRISDGEGDVLFAEETNYPALRSYVLSKISQMHFGRGSSVIPENADLFLNEMRNAIDDADVLGIPNAARIVRGFRRDPQRMDVRGQTGNRKGLAVAIELARKDKLKNTIIGDAFFSRQLLEHYSTILPEARTIVLVSCHADIVGPMQRLSGVQDVRLIEVPLQSSQMHGKINSHFPDAYRRICQEISQQPPGALFLIGAGPLAKHYCALAKRAGGIAIDVGAVMDFWAGRSGRGTIKKETLEKWSILDKQEVEPKADGVVEAVPNPAREASAVPTAPREAAMIPARKNSSVYVHIGLAKTGTTTLQRNYFSLSPAVNYLGKKGEKADFNEQSRALTRRPDRGYDSDKGRQVVTPYLKAPGVPVFSDEDMTVYKFLHPRQMGERVGKLFDDIRLIYVTRRPLDWIKSQYFFRLETYNVDCLGGINSWLDTHFARKEVGSDISEIRFAETFRAFHDAAGKPPFLILPYEMMVADIDMFLTRIEEFMGLDGELRKLLPEAEKDPKKVRIGHRQANFIRILSLYHTDHEKFMDRATDFAMLGSRDMQREFSRLRGNQETRLEHWIEFFKLVERRVIAGADLDERLNEALSEFDDYEIRPDLKARIAEIEARETLLLQRDYEVDLTGYGYGMSRDAPVAVAQGPARP